MNQRNNLLNDQMANIYEGILQGQKYSLAQLQALKTKEVTPTNIRTQNQTISRNLHKEKEWDSPADIIHSINKEQSNILETISAINLAHQKQHYFVNALKAGVKLNDHTKKQINPYLPKSRWVNSQLQNYNAPSKRIKSHIKQTKRQSQAIKKDTSQQLRINQHSQESSDIDNKMSIALPKVTINQSKHTIDLPKVKSSQIQPLIKGNVMFQSLSPPKQQTKRHKKQLRDIVGLSKKLKIDLQQQNENEQKLQIEIMQYHQSTKTFLSSIFNKYGLNINNKAKYIKKRKTISLDTSGQSSKADDSLEKSHSDANLLSNETSTCQQLQADISQLTSKSQTTSLKLKQIGEQLDCSPYLFYLYNQHDKIQEQQQQDQAEDKDIVPNVSRQRQKYMDIMLRLKEKKWSLMQRTEYESHRKDVVSQTRKPTYLDGPQSSTHPMEMTFSQQNKIVVNSRLKNLLFS